MDTNQPKENMRESILGKIRAEKLSMRPRLYFTLQMAALAIVAIAIGVLSIFIFNFIAFSIRINNDDALLGFGSRGIATFLYFFPWALLVLDVALVGLLEWLARQFRFGYKIPVLYLLIGLLVATLGIGVALDRGTGINDHFLRQSDEHRLPGPFGDWYGHARRSPPPDGSICRCTIVAIEGNTLTLQDSRSTTTLTALLPDNDSQATTTSLQAGDTVLVAGDVQDGVLHVFGLRKLAPRGQ